MTHKSRRVIKPQNQQSMLELPTLDQEVWDSNPPGGGFQLMIVQHFIAWSHSLSSFHYLNET